jgi:hypothetical protein
VLCVVCCVVCVCAVCYNPSPSMCIYPSPSMPYATHVLFSLLQISVGDKARRKMKEKQDSMKGMRGMGQGSGKSMRGMGMGMGMGEQGGQGGEGGEGQEGQEGQVCVCICIYTNNIYTNILIY